MSSRILTAVLFVAIMSLLVMQRFFGPPEWTITVAAVDKESHYHTSEKLHRGEVVTTPNGFLELQIGQDTHVYLAAHTELELYRIFEDEVVLKLKKGRIVVSTVSELPVLIKTNTTESLVHKSSASFVNYNFLQTVHVIPLTDSVQVKIDQDYLLTPAPLSIREIDPVTYETLEVNLGAGDAKTFYEWVDILTNE